MAADQVAIHGYRHERGGVDEIPVWPIGMIGIWDDVLEALPSGFVLCDGENGTPDLRGLMVLGAGGSYDRGDTGGSETQADHDDHETERAAASGAAEIIPVDVAMTHSAHGTNLPPYHALYFVKRIA